MKCILRGSLSFSGRGWESVSEDAKNMIRAMLKPNAEDRPTAEQVLSEWGEGVGRTRSKMGCSGVAIVFSFMFFLGFFSGLWVFSGGFLGFLWVLLLGFFFTHRRISLE